VPCQEHKEITQKRTERQLPRPSAFPNRNFSRRFFFLMETQQLVEERMAKSSYSGLPLTIPKSIAALRDF
jgi:hypothetical protein